MNLHELEQLRQWVAQVAGVPVRDVELVHGVTQSWRDVPEYLAVYTGSLADYQEPARARLRAASIETPADHDTTLLALTYEVSVAWKRQRGAVLLYEDNAGGLYIVHGPSGWARTQGQPSRFADDAAAVRRGDTADWTVSVMSPADIAELERSATLIATYDGRLNILRNEQSGMVLAGHAGRRYLGLDQTEVE